MAYLTIPIDTEHPNHEFSIELDLKIYLLRFKYNYRSNRWAMDVKEEDGTMIVSGVPLVTSFPLLARFKDSRLPEGDLFVVDSSGAESEPTEASFGSTHTLIYREVGTDE